LTFSISSAGDNIEDVLIAEFMWAVGDIILEEVSTIKTKFFW